jgi:hypothetical protein
MHGTRANCRYERWVQLSSWFSHANIRFALILLAPSAQHYVLLLELPQRLIFDYGHLWRLLLRVPANFSSPIALSQALDPMACQVYRVRARNARIRAMRRTTLTSTCKNKAVEPRIIAIIIRYFSRVVCYCMQKYPIKYYLYKVAVQLLQVV